MDCFHKLFLSDTPSENSQSVWDLGNRMAGVCRFDAKWVCTMGCVAWDVMPELFKCSVWEMRRHLISGIEHLNTSGITSYGPGHIISGTEHLNASGITSHGTDSFRVELINPGHPIPKISDWLFSEGLPERHSLWKQSTYKRGRHQKRNQTDSTRNVR